ncbi:heat shock factor 2-binding protein, partial [Mantella aurantiaca]
MSGSSGAEFVVVRRRDLDRLVTEVMQMRDFLPQIINSDLVENLQRLEETESALECMDQDCDHIRARLEMSQGEYLRAKEENLSLLVRLSSQRDLSVQQSDHMTSMLCTLLWSVSNREETVMSILRLETCDEFFMLAAQAVTGYVDGLGEKPQDEDNQDGGYVLGLAGIIT